MQKNHRTDDRGVSSIIELILSFTIAALIFTLLIMNSNDLFVKNPRYIVTMNQFADVGNGVSTMLIDTYLIVPDNGTMITYFDVPDSVAGTTYQISIQKYGSDREVRVFSADDTSVSVTLNGANSTIPINGTTSSTDIIHGIKYNSTNKVI